MYETMIDRPALVYDSLSNLTSSITKNFTLYCSFFVQQLNYTPEQCESLAANTIIDLSQVRTDERNERTDPKGTTPIDLSFSVKEEKRYNRRCPFCFDNNEQ